MTDAIRAMRRAMTEEVSESQDLLDLIDRLNRRGVSFVPRVAHQKIARGFAFEFEGQHVSASALGNHGSGVGRFLYSPPRHDPIFRKICEMRRSGLPQPMTLKGADVDTEGLPPASVGSSMTPSLLSVILMLDNDPDPAGSPSLYALPNGYDDLSHRTREDLLADLQLEEIPDGFEHLTEDHQASALRWMMRGLRPDLAVLREKRRSGLELSCENLCPSAQT